MPQHILLFAIILLVLGCLLWFLIAALKRTPARAENDSEPEKQLGNLTAEMQTVQRQQQDLSLAQKQVAEKLEGLRKNLEQAKREVGQAELAQLMEQHLALDEKIEQQTENLLELLAQAVASQQEMNRLGCELDLQKDFSMSFEFLTAYVAWKMRTVFGQGLQLASDGRQQSVSELDKAFFEDAQAKWGKNFPEAKRNQTDAGPTEVTAGPPTDTTKPCLGAPQPFSKQNQVGS